MFKQWFAIVCVTALMAVHVKGEKLQCPKECTCKDHSNEMIITMSCKTLDLSNKVSVPITNFELLQNDKPIIIPANAFANMGLEKAHTITITNSTIISIDKDAFKGLNELTTVRIMHTRIAEIHPDTFATNKELKTLYLHNNPLKNFQGLNSNYISELILSDCNLKELNKDMFKTLSALGTLNLRENQIKTLTPGIFDAMSDLSEIHLERNQITEIPESMFDNNLALTYLYLDGNPITTISNINAEDLDTLSLKECKITSLEDDSLNGFADLLNLDLSDNQISKISNKAFSKLVELQTINLAGNKIKELTKDIFYNNVNLEKIVLDNNKNITLLPTNGFIHNKSIKSFNVYWFSCQNCGLKSLSEMTFSTMTGLVTLKLSHNKISDIRNGVFSRLPRLKEVDISHNQIVTMDDETFKHNQDLSSLNLAGNPLKTLHPSIFKHNANLKDLDLHSCGLASLWTGEKSIQLESIQNLNISDNKIILITLEDIQVTNKLKSLDVSGNDLSCTDSYKTLVDYLTEKEIQDTQYRTHEEMILEDKDETVEEMNVALMGIWKEQAKIKCPNLKFIDETHVEEKKVEKIEATTQSAKVTTADDVNTDDEDDGDDDDDDDADDDHGEEEENEDESVDDNPLPFVDGESDNITMNVRAKYEKYSYMWLTLIFLGVSLVTLGVVANLILFIIRRRQLIEVPRINIRPISKLKKNSGLVYQQLSEERDGTKTPVLSRFIPIPSVHTPNAPQYV